MKVKKSTFILLITLLFLIGCTANKLPIRTENENIAMKYLQSKKYKVISTTGNSYDYVLTKQLIQQPPYKTIWGLQSNSPDQYFNKTINTYSFVVKNHPLENTAKLMKLDAQIQVNVFIHDKEVIGGSSYIVPNDGSVVFGGVNSVDGKSIEELTGMNYSDWTTYWDEKYNE